MDLYPQGDRVVIKANEETDTRPSGLVIPDIAREKPQTGIVIAVGPGVYEDGIRVPVDVKAGETVVYSKYGGTEIRFDGEDFLVVSARDILAAIR